MLWAFVCVASVELVVVHLLLALWRPWVALVLSIATGASIIWLVGVIRSMRRLPVLIEPERLVLRVGTLSRVDVPRASVVGLRSQWNASTFRQRDAVKLSLLAYPNVVVELDPPVPGRRAPVRLVGHRLDDAPAFVAALNRWIATPSPSE